MSAWPGGRLGPWEGKAWGSDPAALGSRLGQGWPLQVRPALGPGTRGQPRLATRRIRAALSKWLTLGEAFVFTQ